MIDAHVHKIGTGGKCEQCDYVLVIPPVLFMLEVFDGDKELINEGFNCSDVSQVIDALRDAADKLEQGV